MTDQVTRLDELKPGKVYALSASYPNVSVELQVLTPGMQPVCVVSGCIELNMPELKQDIEVLSDDQPPLTVQLLGWASRRQASPGQPINFFWPGRGESTHRSALIILAFDGEGQTIIFLVDNPMFYLPESS